MPIDNRTTRGAALDVDQRLCRQPFQSLVYCWAGYGKLFRQFRLRGQAFVADRCGDLGRKIGRAVGLNFHCQTFKSLTFKNKDQVGEIQCLTPSFGMSFP